MTAATLAVERPGLRLLVSEPLRAAKELVSLAFMDAPADPVGGGHAVIVFPGLIADGRSVRALRRHCRSLGFDAMDWGRGYNFGPRGDVDEWLAELTAHTLTLLGDAQRSVTLIGWSLGGLYAREVAKRLGPQVRRVITIGTPFRATVDQTNVGWLFRLLSIGNAESAPDSGFARRLRRPPPVPTSSIYSRSDGVVPWQSCRHGSSSRMVEDIEIEGSHLGMGWNPAVLRAVADRLTRDSAEAGTDCL